MQNILTAILYFNSVILKSIAKAIVYSNLWFGLCVGGYYAGNCLYLRQQPDVGYAMLLILGTVLVYSLPILLLWKGQADIKFLTPRQKWAFENPVAFFSSILLAGILIVIDFNSLSHVTALLPTALIAITYLFPIIPLRSGFKKAREIPVLKNVLLALAFLWCCTAMPMLKNNQWDLSFILFQFTVLLSISLAFDFRDYERDKNMGLKTMLTNLSPTSSLRLIHLTNYIALTVAAFWCMIDNPFPAWALFAYLPFHFIAFHFIGKGVPWHYYLSVIDSLLLIQALLIWLVLFIFA